MAGVRGIVGVQLCSGFRSKGNCGEGSPPPAVKSLPRGSSCESDSIQKNNVLAVQSKHNAVKGRELTARQQLELEVQMLLEEQRQEAANWLKDELLPENIVVVESKRHLKELICSEDYAACIVNFTSPECHACTSLWPKLVQLAEQNPSIMFAKVNTALPEMVDIAEGLSVPKLPWFLIFQGGVSNMVASFTANVTTLNVLRAEISRVKECMDAGCAF
jgi:thiol-disulfide isomerase/thioredoxin